jgi:hypothetical protein
MKPGADDATDRDALSVRHSHLMDASSSSDPDIARAWLDRTAAEMARFVSPTVHTFLPLYLGRADVRFALGDPPAEIVAELLGAARCWSDNAALYLHSLPLNRLRSRRLTPLELALITGDPAVVAALRDSVATDAMSVMAHTEADALAREIHTVAGGPIAEPPADRMGVAGRLGLLYWLALGAVLRGERAAFEATRLLAEPLLDGLPDQGPLARLAALHAALAAVSAGDTTACAAAIARHSGLHDAEASARAAAAGPDDPPHPGAIDLSGLATAQIAAAFGLDVRPGLRALDPSPYGPAGSGPRSPATLLSLLDLLAG